MGRTIPERWLNYKPIGERIEGTRFIAFKVPLRRHITENVEEANRLDDEILLKAIPNLGMIIDLTNTNRYYNPNFFKSKGLEYRKLMIPGHHTPAPRLVEQFKILVMNFLDNNTDNDKLIGVHCTHGVNRTGYLICNYMISELDMTPAEAITKFAVARGHKIERENYLDSLNGRRHSSSTESSSTTLKNDSSRLLNEAQLPTTQLKRVHSKEPISWRVHPEPAPPPFPRIFDRRDRFERCRQDVDALCQRYVTAASAEKYRDSRYGRHHSSRYVNYSSNYGGGGSNNPNNYPNNYSAQTNNHRFAAYSRANRQQEDKRYRRQRPFEYHKHYDNAQNTDRHHSQPHRRI